MDDRSVKRSSARPLGLLLSDAVNEGAGSRIDLIASAADITLRRYTLQQAADPAKIHAAFFSRDLYEGSSLRKPGPLSDGFFNVVDRAPNLQWLHVCTSGQDLPQYAKSLERGLRITTSTGTTATPIAQTVLAAILAQSRGFDHWLSAQARKQWLPMTGPDKPKEISDHHVVVVGAGAIGSEIGRLLKAVGLRTTAVRRSATAAPHFDKTIAPSQLDLVLPDCDWLVLALPLTAQTHGLIDSRRLALLPPHAGLVNVARGELVDETALAEALRSGRLRRAYLDTFIEEPLPADSPLWELPNVWISPHNSAAAQGHDQRVVEAFMRELQAWLDV